jgi:hypothetical protein
MTKTQEEVLEEFARMELADKIDPREYMPAFLLKEAYSELDYIIANSSLI